MKFIVDESSGLAVAECLRRTGHDILVVAEVLPQADDRDILARVDDIGTSASGGARVMRWNSSVSPRAFTR